MPHPKEINRGAANGFGVIFIYPLFTREHVSLQPDTKDWQIAVL
jgi:hypothetical protein